MVVLLPLGITAKIWRGFRMSSRIVSDPGLKTELHMRPFLHRINIWLTSYLRYPGDDDETILHKKIWWLFHIGGFPLLVTASLIIGLRAGTGVLIINCIWIAALIIDLIVFHYHKNGIEIYALVAQIGIVVFASAKAYLMGGMIQAGGVVFIGLMGPVYALTLPNRQRALMIYLLYMGLMLAGTILQSNLEHDYMVSHYLLGFIISVAMIFFTLYYFTSQLDKLKREERYRTADLQKFKSKFYTNLTHELRTPLNIILGMADQVKKFPHKWFNEGLNMITRNGRKLLNLSNQMLDLAKIESSLMPVHFVQDDIIHYLKYLVESFHSLADAKNISVIFSSDPDELVMDFDPDKIQNIISNLITNAIKFTPDNGLVQIAVHHELLELNNYLCIRVEDTGVGIPHSDLPFIFDRYFQVRKPDSQFSEGTGLGLALTRELVLLLNGEITVESRHADTESTGTKFTLFLPITNNATESLGHHLTEHFLENGDSGPKEIMELPEISNSDKMFLLVVEDNEDVVQYISSLLAHTYHIVVAKNGQDGFDKALQNIPDLVISDVMMPRMDGFEFCKKMKQDLRTSHIPVVLLTAKADPQSRLDGFKVGADAYLSKPFNPEELFVRIEKLIELRKGLQNRYRENAEVRGLSQSGQHRYFREDTFLDEIRRILLEHLSDEEFGIDQLCKALGMSRSQLYRKFKALTDITVHQFIRSLRLEKARELLLHTDLNVTEVALDTGFKNLSHFSKIFAEEFGVAPSKTKN